MKWLKAIYPIIIVAILLVAFVYARNVYNTALADASHKQQEISKIKVQLSKTESEKTTISNENKTLEDKVKQLETENAELKG